MNLTNIILPIHIIVLAFAGWTVLSADHLGFNWIRGKTKTLNEEKVAKYHRNTWIALSGLLVTGFTLFWPMRDFLLTRPEFYIKMIFVAALLVNGTVIGQLQKVAISKSFKELTLKEKLPLIISGGVSTAGWLGAFVMAFFLVPG